MGTRGFVGFLTQDGLRGSYNHFDSYPAQLGVQFQKELRALRDEGWVWDRIIKTVPEIRWVDPTMPATAEDIAAFADDEEKRRADTGYYELLRDAQGSLGYYELLRDAQGSLRFPLERRIACDDRDFPRDSLFCEWGWLLDLAAREVVVLRGFNEDPEAQAPYCRGVCPQGYCGCREVWRGDVDAFLGLDMSMFEEAV